MRVTVVTPDASFYDGHATSVSIHAIDGSMGVLPGHAPMIARLGHGVAEVLDGSETHRLAVYGGFVKVQNDVVTVLAGGVGTPDQGDASSARAAYDEVRGKVEKLKAAEEHVPYETEEQLRRARAFLDLFGG
jgi:F-type H+-transporting ATPase subunit epsilon